MNFRVAVLLTIAFLATLMVATVLIAAALDLPERTFTMIGTVITAIIGLTGLIAVYLKMENVEAHVIDNTRHTEAVHHDILNGGLRENVVRAVKEVETDPEIQALKVQRVAAGVKLDRHESNSRAMVKYAEGVAAGRNQERKKLGLPPLDSDTPS